MKGFVSMLLMAVVVGIIVFMFVGIASNYEALPNDVIGIGSVINAISITFREIITISGLTFWTFMFFGIQGIFIYIYLMIGKTIWVSMPQFHMWFSQMKDWFK